MIITIDGPVASGKSSIAKNLAQKLGINHLNSGLLYRGLAYILLNYFDYDNSKLLDINVEDLNEIFSDKKIQYVYENGLSHLIYENRDLTIFLKSPIIDQAASVIGVNQHVRDAIDGYMREYAKNNSIVTDGRDMGSVVFPNANVKIFLTADENVRAERWRIDQLQKGRKYTFEHALNEINTRDERDKNRKIAPLIIPEDGIVIDNSDLNLQQTLDKILKLF